ncbi:hypothetical protein VKT23_020607 [Stygiomarasmius scandens]|uniref:Uncharacterized protein n=1 Tax=Marasmiellus scandens TaxID=2682957 RepID=A0ABR1IJX8_9AGAR
MPSCCPHCHVLKRSEVGVHAHIAQTPSCKAKDDMYYNEPSSEPGPEYELHQPLDDMNPFLFDSSPSPMNDDTNAFPLDNPPNNTEPMSPTQKHPYQATVEDANDKDDTFGTSQRVCGQRYPHPAGVPVVYNRK